MNFLKEKEHLAEVSEEKQDVCKAEFSESSKGFTGSFLVKQEMLSKIRKSKLDLKKEKIFKIPSGLNIFNRQNNIFYFVSTKEMHVDIKDTKGSVFLSLINKEEIKKNLMKINPQIRSTISTVHLGAVKILLKSEFEKELIHLLKWL